MKDKRQLLLAFRPRVAPSKPVMSAWEVRAGDCLVLMQAMPDASVDSIVTDPPYGLSAHGVEAVTACLRAWVAGDRYEPSARGGMMGKAWDAWVPGPEVWREAIRVLKPGGHMLVFAGTRSLDLMGIALRLAGFELRDTIGHAHDGGGAPLLAWAFGSGFPKSANISKLIDKMFGVEREVVGPRRWEGGMPNGGALGQMNDDAWVAKTDEQIGGITAPATPEARQWEGYGTSLKPAFEPILLCRKPLSEKTVAANVLQHGTGGLNIDGCRIEGVVPSTVQGQSAKAGEIYGADQRDQRVFEPHSAGRWPANLILSYPGDEYMLHDDVTPDQLHKLAEWMDENA